MKHLLYFLTVIVFTIMISILASPLSGEDKDIKDRRHDERFGKAHQTFVESFKKHSSFANPIFPHQRRDLNFQTKNVPPNRRLIGSGKNQFHQYKSADDLHSWDELFANDLITKNHTISESTTDSFEIAWVRDFASGLISGDDYARDIVVDANGNIYVTGSTLNGINYYDFTTIKYDPTGNEIWTRHYNGPGNFDDDAYSLAVDLSGNVYVTGTSYFLNWSSDYTTIKYNSNGDTVWVRRYNGPGNSVDNAYDLAVDESGNVYVTGMSYGTSSGSDYATIKYNSSGDMVWIRRYNGSGMGGNSYDVAIALAIDQDRNVFVTGWSTGFSTDYATIKYSSNGDSIWISRYNGPVDSSDYAYDLAVDGNGNVFVTGESYGTATGYDYATIKYNSSGETVWVNRYNGSGNSCDGASSIAIDDNGNVYITGISEELNGHLDYATIKYNSSGYTIWIRMYNMLFNYWYGYTPALATDDNGNVYVAGGNYVSGQWIDYATIKYNSNGDTIWIRMYNGPFDFDCATALAIDTDGNVFVTGDSHSAPFMPDYTTIKYNPSGDSVWVQRYDGFGESHDYSTSLVVDGSGNVYTAGVSLDQNDFSDHCSIIKYNSSGDTLWIRNYGNDILSYNSTCAMSIDETGNVYVACSSYSSDTYSDFFTIKYNSTGDTIWTKKYNGPTNEDDLAISLVTDMNGNVYVTGKSNGYNGLADYTTIKYNLYGDTVWVRRYNGPGNGVDIPAALAVDGNENVYVTGESYGAGTVADYATIKYNSSGDTVWIRRYDSGRWYYDYASALTVDDSENVIVTGRSYELNTFSYDYATIKYNSSGDLVWVKKYDGPGNADDRPIALAADGSGNVYVTGKSEGAETFYDYATIKYNSDGDTIWIRRYNGIGNSNDEVTSLAIDGYGNVYVAGGSFDLDNYCEYVLIKYNSAGEQEGIARYKKFEYGQKLPAHIYVDSSGSLYLAGASRARDQSMYTTIKYNQIPVSINKDNPEIRGFFSLDQNYPNPFNPTTNISWQLAVGSIVKLSLYDVSGQKIADLVNENQPAGNHQIEFNASKLASGVYFYRLSTESLSGKGVMFSQTRKLLLLR